jgi:phospholipase/carboxylesterase
MTQSYRDQKAEIGRWTLRMRIPESPGPHPVVLMLHGWTGDEDAMWVFATRLPKHALLLAPRGIFRASLGGYGWHGKTSSAWPWVDDFRPSMEALLELLTPTNFPDADLDRFRLVGFSQGAALAFSVALSYPERVSSMAVLSGFLPEGAGAMVRDAPLREKHIFMAHGTQDQLVPVERARQAAEILRQAGASVFYCEDDVGHKLSADCFRGMQAFFQRY